MEIRYLDLVSIANQLEEKLEHKVKRDVCLQLVMLVHESELKTDNPKQHLLNKTKRHAVDLKILSGGIWSLLFERKILEGIKILVDHWVDNGGWISAKHQRSQGGPELSPKVQRQS